MVLRGDGSGAGSGAGSGEGFAVGDGVEVVGPGGSGTAAFGSVVTVDTDGVVVELTGARQTPLPQSGLLRLRVDDNQRTIRLRAIERVVRERHTLRWVGPVLTGAEPAPLASVGSRGQLWEPERDPPLTEGQGRALVGATAAADVFLVQGPPGTGKTTVIAELLRYLAYERGARILLSSRGHRAIDNALDRLEGLELQVLRLGQSSKVTGAGQARLLTEVVRQAETDIPAHQPPVQACVDALQHALAEISTALARLEYLHAAIAAGDAMVADRLADIDAWLADAHQDLRARMADERAAASSSPLGAWFTQTFAAADREARYRKSADQLGQRQRALLDRADFVQLRTHVADLRAELQRLTTNFPQLAPVPAGIAAPTISLVDADAVRASLADVRRAQAQLELAIPALQAWWMLVDQPQGLARCVVTNTDIVAATAIGVDSGRDGARVADLDFDVAVIDEASQAHLMDLVVPLSRSRTVILVGDHRQLPPYLDADLRQRCAASGIDPEWLETSVFEYLWERVPTSHRARLDMQFRMPATIADFLGTAFYDGELASAPSKRHMPPVCGLFAAAVVFVDTSDDPRRTETALAQGFVNRCEAELTGLLGAALPAQLSLGVIAPYAAQVGAIRQMLARARGLSPRDPWLIDNVATVDSFQGQERDVVVVSLTRSNAEGAVGFLADLNRLNVTLSRARAQLVIVGDYSTLSAATGSRTGSSTGSSGGGQRREAFARFMRGLVEHLRTDGEVMPSAVLRARLADV